MLKRAEARLLQGLARRKAREESGLFLAEGVRVVEELVGAGLDLRIAVVSSTLEDTTRGQSLRAALESRVAVHTVTDAELTHLAATESPQGVVVAAEIPRVRLSDVPPAGRALALVLDAVQDPGNFGTVVRSAVAFDAMLVAALPGTVDPWNPKAVRASAGTLFRIPVVQTELGPLLEWLRAHEFAVLAADMGGEDVERVRVPERVAFVVGNEGAGLSPEVRAAADAMVAVGTPGPAESLNVAVAAGILLYRLRRES